MRRFGIAGVAIFLAAAVIIAGCTSNGTSPAKPSGSATKQSTLTPGEADRGRAVYVSLCYGCHAQDAKIGPSFASEEFKAKYQTADALTKVVRTGRHPMPQFSPEQLGDQAIADLLAFLRTAKDQ